MQDSFINKLKRFDKKRSSFPGEHWLALGAGLWFLQQSGGSGLSRFASKAIGAGLILRAASGRDGLRRFWRAGPEGTRIPRAHQP